MLSYYCSDWSIIYGFKQNIQALGVQKLLGNAE